MTDKSISLCMSTLNSSIITYKKVKNHFTYYTEFEAQLKIEFLTLCNGDMSSLEFPNYHNKVTT